MQHTDTLNLFCNKGYITINIKIKFILDFAPYYAFILDNKCYNMRTGRFIKQVSNNGSIGYIINGDFMSLTKLRLHLIKQK